MSQEDQGSTMLVAKQVIATTDSSALIELEDGERAWFPFSRCENLYEVAEGEEEEFDCPNWILIDRGLDDYIDL